MGWGVSSEKLCKDGMNGRAKCRNLLLFQRNSKAGKKVLAGYTACLVFLKGEPRVGRIALRGTQGCEQKGLGLLLCPLRSRV